MTRDLDEMLEALARQSTTRQRDVYEGLERQGWTLVRVDNDAADGPLVLMAHPAGRHFAAISASGKLQLRAADQGIGRSIKAGRSAPVSTASDPHERRRGQPPVPANLNDHLTELQLLALERLRSFGWRILFVRRPPGEVPTVVVGGPERGQVGILMDNGEVDRTTKLKIR